MSKVFTIAEVGQTHEGSLGILHSYIDALATTGVDAVKFQTHIAAAESSKFEPFRIEFSYEDKTRFDYWKRMEFTTEQWKGIKDHCDQAGLEFISSPFSNAAVDLLEEIGVDRYKVGSGEVSNLLLIQKIAGTGKDIIISSGMSSFDELDKAVRFIQSFGIPCAILQCTTTYPCPPSRWGLNVIAELSQRYKVPVGFSDHSGDIYAGLAAASLGAEILEFHTVFDKRMFGPDTMASLTIDQIKMLQEGVNQISESLAAPVDKSDNSIFTSVKKIFEKSLAVNRYLPKNHIITFEDLEAKKPRGHGIDAGDFNTVIGKKLRSDKDPWDFLKAEDLLDD